MPTIISARLVPFITDSGDLKYGVAIGRVLRRDPGNWDSVSFYGNVFNNIHNIVCLHSIPFKNLNLCRDACFCSWS